tara:strand:+ start:1834 stop:2037 length:204 start_codon:yes stop_codon:yes gene_type:complete
MKAIIAGFLNYKTTLIGLTLSILMIVQDKLDGGIQINDPRLWIAIAIAVFGFVSRDADKSSQDSKIK